MPAMREYRAETAPCCLVKYVAKHSLPARSVVEIDGATAMNARAADMMKKVITQRRATLGGIPPHIKGTAIIRFHAGMMDLVEIDDMIVAREADGLMGAIVQQIVRKPNADPANVNVVSMRPLSARDVMNMIVDNLVTAWTQRFAITTADLQPGGAGVQDVASNHPVIRSTVHNDAIHAYVANATAHNVIVVSACDFDAVAGAGFHSEIAEGHM